MNVRPIRTEADHRWALAEVEPYFACEPEPGTPESDRFEVLATLIEAYEARTDPLPAADPVEVIRFIMEQTGRTQHDLAELLGSRSRASELLNRRRPLTLTMAHRLSTTWRIPIAALVRPYPTERRAA